MLEKSYTLPCGQTLTNRLVKAAMTERIAGANHNPNRYHFKLYETWARGGAGLLLSGNIMVDRNSMESAGNVVLEDDRAMDKFQEWTRIATAGDSQFWAQINHSGRQTSRLVNMRPVSASPVQLHEKGLYGKPRALTEKGIQDMIQKYRTTARLCMEAGFQGIQVHAAHGYLLSQFLSPITNRREDDWGGSLENRARLLLEIVRAVRSEIGPRKALSVKLNSADFQKGGFDQDESEQVAGMLEKEGIDLLEISGGNYESPSFLLNDQNGVRESTKKREAYFLDFAGRLRTKIKTPLMITGGFRSRSFCEEALASGDTDFIGIARPFLVSTNFAADFLSGKLEQVELPQLKPSPAFGLMSEGGWYAYQISKRLSRGKEPKMNLGAFHAVSHILWHETKKSMAHRLLG
ncbi:MAG: hypothetical protein CMF59_08685 [Leptospiraceae bacterium]|nr:hypothetical protein [Leptospiraceae bacterium]